MPFAFFGLCLEPEKTYSQTVSKSFRISMASLGEEITSTERSCVKVDVDGEEFVLCSLNPGSHEQQTLDLVFETEEEISLSVTGKNTVHLTGNYLPEEDHDHDDMEYDSAEFESSDDDVEGEEDYSDEEEVSQEDLDRLRALVASHAEDDDEDSEEDPDFSELDEDEDDEEDLEDDEEEDEDVDEDMEDAEPVEIGQKRKAEKASPMAEKKMKDNTAAAVKTVQPSKAEKTIKTEKKAEITATESKTTSETQAPADKPLSKKQKKAAAAKARAEQEAEKAKAKSVEKVAEVQKAKAKPEQKVSESPIKKVLGNGLQIEDVKVGTGVRAKKGKKVGVRYIGKLASNGKVFDKNVSGKPFVFNLGRGEVIKGWDMGVDGMSVGGERRLLIPAVLAYGTRGAPPDIPKNATLEFEVKLLSVN